MKKFYIGLAVFVVLVISLGVAGFAYAQSQRTPESGYPFGPMHGGKGGFGYGMMGGAGGYAHGPGMMGWNGEYGPMHEAMETALTEATGLTEEEIEARIEAGESMWEIAESEGLSVEEIQDLMLSVHNSYTESAVENGWMTLEQADWMSDHMAQMWNGTWEGGSGGHCGGWER